MVLGMGVLASAAMTVMLLSRRADRPAEPICSEADRTPVGAAAAAATRILTEGGKGQAGGVAGCGRGCCGGGGCKLHRRGGEQRGTETGKEARRGERGRTTREEVAVGACAGEGGRGSKVDVLWSPSKGERQEGDEAKEKGGGVRAGAGAGAGADASAASGAWC